MKKEDIEKEVRQFLSDSRPFFQQENNVDLLTKFVQRLFVRHTVDLADEPEDRKYFVFDPQEGTIKVYDSPRLAKTGALNILEEMQEEASNYQWDDKVDDLMWGEIRQITAMTSIDKREDNVLDEDNNDERGRHWEEHWSDIREYSLMDIKAVNELKKRKI